MKRHRTVSKIWFFYENFQYHVNPNPDEFIQRHVLNVVTFYVVTMYGLPSMATVDQYHEHRFLIKSKEIRGEEINKMIIFLDCKIDHDVSVMKSSRLCSKGLSR